MLIRANHFQTGLPCDVKLLDGRIASLSRCSKTNRPDLHADLIAPAYFDLQINGALGVNLTSSTLTLHDIERVIEACADHGIAAFCPTIITSSNDTILHSMQTLAKACESHPGIQQSMPCFHLEGPFLSPDDGPRGAHPRQHVQAPNWDLVKRWQHAAGGRIKLLTLAPELPGALPLIETLVKHQIIPAIAHSTASPPIIRDAIAAGARLSTHLGNGCARLIPRHDNPLWEQLASDELQASFIPDGHHLPWSLVRCILRCKSLERLIITCDASPLAGLPPGKFSNWEQEVEITSDGKCLLAKQGVLAGSWDFTDTCIEKLMLHQQLSYHEVHPLASDHPRKLLNLPVPTLENNQPANLVLLTKDAAGNLKHSHSIIQGKLTPMPPTAAPASDAAR